MRSDVIEVWAPNASRVSVHSGSQQLRMRPSKSGWWTSDRLSGEGFVDYRISVNDGEPRPDPRSQHQPRGVGGPSRRVDHSQFVWSDQGFQARPLSSAVIYELHVGTFSSEGTFDGVIGYLDHLVQLGVTHVELMPVAEFPGAYGWGYDGVCLFAPSSNYGGPEGLKRLVNACHQRDLAVVLDVVYNHLGPVGNHLEEFGPYFTDGHRTPWGKAINFDGPCSDEVRRFFCDNAAMWLRDYHIDALRLDAVHAIVDTTAYPFLEQLADEVRQLSAHLGRHLTLIAESDWNDPRLVRSQDAGGLELHAQWCDDFHHALHTALTGEDRGYYADFGGVADLAKAFEHPYVYTGQASASRQRSHGRYAAGIRADRFVVYSQNHDQIGNRAEGERLGHMVGARRAQIAAALVLASPYVPQLFQGEEWNTDVPFMYFADWREEPELAKAVLQGRQEEFASFGWSQEELIDPTAEEAFLACKLDWASLNDPDHADMFAWYRQLIALRKSTFDLTDNRLHTCSAQADPHHKWIRVLRGSVMIAAYLGQTPGCVPLPENSRWEIVLANSPIASSGEAETNGGLRKQGELIELSSCWIRMPKDSVAVLRSVTCVDQEQAPSLKSERGEMLWLR